MGQQAPRGVTVRTLLVLAMGDVSPEAFRRGAVGGYGAFIVAFAVGTLSGVVEEDEEVLLLKLHF